MLLYYKLMMPVLPLQDESDEFWCHMGSALLHPVGWSQQTGHKLHSSQEYRSQCLSKITMLKYEPKDATPDMFKTVSRRLVSILP